MKGEKTMNIREMTIAKSAEIRRTMTEKIRYNCKMLVLESDSTEYVLVTSYYEVREEVKAGNAADIFRVKDSNDIHFKTVKYESARSATIRRLVNKGILIPVPCRRSIPGKNSPVLYGHEEAEKIISVEVVKFLYGEEALKDLHYTGQNENHWADFRIYGIGFEIKCKGAWHNDKNH